MPGIEGAWVSPDWDRTDLLWKLRAEMVHRFLQGDPVMITADVREWLKNYCPDTWALVCKRLHGV